MLATAGILAEGKASPVSYSAAGNEYTAFFPESQITACGGIWPLSLNDTGWRYALPEQTN